jgi:hypothetical protein
MARIGMDDFTEGTEIVRVYLAASLREAEAVEHALEDAGVDYAPETETYEARSALGSRSRTGVGFWVVGSGVDAAADALARAGLVKGLVER